MTKLHRPPDQREDSVSLLEWIAVALVSAFLLAVVALGRPANAAEVSADIGHGFSNVVGAGALDPTFNKPIDYTPITFDFIQASGRLIWGASAELAQNGRAGVAADKVVPHLAAAFHIGPVTVAPQLQLGYSRAPNLDYGLVGGELRISVPTPILTSLSTELAVRRRQSFAVNYFANAKGSGLPTNPWSETRFEAAEVWQINSRVAVGLHGDIDRGSNPDKVVGIFTRLSF